MTDWNEFYRTKRALKKMRATEARGRSKSFTPSTGRPTMSSQHARARSRSNAPQRANILMVAEETGDVSSCLALIEAGMNVNAEYGSQGCTALHAAAENGRFEMTSQLLNAGAELDKRNRLGYTALMLAIKWRKNDYKLVARLLLSAGSAVDARNTFHKSALFYAAENRDLAAIAILCEGGASGGLEVCAAFGANTVIDTMTEAYAQKFAEESSSPSAIQSNDDDDETVTQLRQQVEALNEQLRLAHQRNETLHRELHTVRKSSPMFPRRGMPAITVTDDN